MDDGFISAVKGPKKAKSIVVIIIIVINISWYNCKKLWL